MKLAVRHGWCMTFSWRSVERAKFKRKYSIFSEKWIFWSNCAMRTHTSNGMNTHSVAWHQNNILAIYRILFFQRILSPVEIRMQQNKYDLLSFIRPAATAQHFIFIFIGGFLLRLHDTPWWLMTENHFIHIKLCRWVPSYISYVCYFIILQRWKCALFAIPYWCCCKWIKIVSDANAKEVPTIN